MTEFIDNDGTMMTEVTEANIKRYMEIAEKAFLDKSPNQTFLPLSPTKGNDAFMNLFNSGFFSGRYTYTRLRTLDKTLDQTLKSASPQQISDLVYEMVNHFEGASDYYSLNNKEICQHFAYSLAVSLLKSEVLDKLDAKAKLSIASLYKRTNLSKHQKEKLTDFELSAHNSIDSENTIYIAKKLFNQNGTSWENKASALKVLAHYHQYGTDSKILVETFAALVRSAEEPEQVDQLANLAEEMSWAFQEQKYNLSKEAIVYWSEKLPNDKSTQHLFYKYIQATDPQLIQMNVFPPTHPLCGLYTLAFNECKADKELLRLRNTGKCDTETIMKFGQEKFNCKTDFAKLDTRDQEKFLSFYISIFAPKDYLTMAKTFLDNDHSSVSVQLFSQMLNVADSIRPATDKKLAEFCASALKKSKELAELAENKRQYINERDELYKAGITAQQELHKFNHMEKVLYELQNTYQDIERNKGEKDTHLQREAVEALIANHLSGKTGKSNIPQLEVRPLGKIEKLFAGNDKTVKHLNLEKAVGKFNNILAECFKEPGFKDYQGKILNDSSRGELRMKSAKENGEIQRINNTLVRYREYDQAVSFIKGYNSARLDERINLLDQRITSAKAELKNKAQTALAMGFKGMDVSKPMLEEHEQRATEAYAKQAESVGSKLRELHKDDLKERGILDRQAPDGRPGDADSSKAGRPIDKNTKEQITDLVRTKKTYEKLSKR